MGMDSLARFGTPDIKFGHAVGVVGESSSFLDSEVVRHVLMNSLIDTRHGPPRRRFQSTRF